MADEGEERRMIARARRIWGDRPFSAEEMEFSRELETIQRRSGKAQRRLDALERLAEEEFEDE